MRYSSLIHGTRARKTIEIQFVGQEKPTKVDLRVLTTAEEADMRAGATAFAEKRGLKGVSEGNAIYDLGLWAHTALMACIDTDSPVDAPVPFFASIDEVLDARGTILPDHLAFLTEHQQEWQEANSPYVKNMDDVDVVARAIRIVNGEIFPLVELRPGMRWTFVHILAVQYLASRVLKSRSTSPSEETSSTKAEEDSDEGAGEEPKP